MPVDNLEEAIRKRLPALRGQAYGLESTEAYASSLRRLCEDPYSLFEVTNDHEALVKLRGNLSAAISALNGLSRSTKTQLTIGLGARNGEQPISRAEVAATLDRLIVGVRRAERYIRHMPPASKKRNWVAAAVAFECQWLWGLNDRISEGDFPPVPSGRTDLECHARVAHFEKEYREWCGRVWAAAPTSQRFHDPGKFGRFVEEVFEELGIVTSDGSPVRAATALESLRDFARQEDNED